MSRMDDPVTGLPLAGFWQRAFGRLIDGFLVFVLTPPVYLALAVMGGIGLFFAGAAIHGLRSDLPSADAARVLVEQMRRAAETEGRVDLLIAPLLASAAYWIGSVTGWGATPGMMAVGVRVVRAEDGDRPGPGRAALRWAAGIPSCLPLGFGALWSAFRV